jgi:hypothetical protein
VGHDATRVVEGKVLVGSALQWGGLGSRSLGFDMNERMNVEQPERMNE